MICPRIRLLLSAALFLAIAPAIHAQGWIAPTPEELKMTSIPEVPGAEAVILNRDELDDDDNHMESIYVRAKILTEAGIDLANVKINYNKRSDGRGYSAEEVSGRTVQPDGTIVPFTGKPFDKLQEKIGDNRYMERTFTLPAVQVGSIIEYRYTLRWDDTIFFSPSWNVQGNLYVRKAHYLWKPTNKELLGTTRGGRESISERLAWSVVLPKGVDLKQTRSAMNRLSIELDVANVMPFLEEEFMPPIQSSAYHAVFYYTPYTSGQEYWDTEVKYWNTDTNHFTSASDMVRSQASAATAGATTDEEKARKLYAFIMTLENTDYTRERTSTEENKAIKSAEDVLKRKHGSSDELAMTYVALARAAGLTAATVRVVDRSQRLFQPQWFNMDGQLTDNLAVVTWGGADHFLDPGSRYEPFGHLAWQHSLTVGVRQDNKDKSKQFIETPIDGYKFSHTSRVADVKLDSDGHMTGPITITYEGSPALRWRHVALRNDDAELRKRLKKEMEDWMPQGTEVTITDISDINNGEAPLKVKATVDGHLGNVTGSRVMLPSALFEANSRPTFPHEKRDQAVYFPYAEIRQDAVRYTLPQGYAVESAPVTERAKYESSAAYSLTSSQAANTITLRRDLVLGEILFPLANYPQLRTFYADFEHKDHGAVILKRTDSAQLAPAAN